MPTEFYSLLADTGVSTAPAILLVNFMSIREEGVISLAQAVPGCRP